MECLFLNLHKAHIENSYKNYIGNNGNIKASRGDDQHKFDKILTVNLVIIAQVALL